MKIIPGLALTAGFIFFLPMALADDETSHGNSRSARAVQVHIDKDTGRKAVPDDSEEHAANGAAQSISAADASGIMPARNQPLQHHADGTMSFRLGMESMRFMVLSIDEDGQKTVTHQSLDEFENQDVGLSPNKGDK